jgi:hypothetical protein
MYEQADEFTLPIYVSDDLIVEETLDAVPTRPFPKQAMNQLVGREKRTAEGLRRIDWARRLLLRFGFGLPEQRGF